jgi:hypothetical protein
MAITTAISDFVKSIYELFESFFTTLFGLVNTVVSAVVTFFADLINLVVGTLKGSLNVLGETGKFIFGEPEGHEKMIEARANYEIGNAILIIIVAAGAVGYLQYQRSQGKPVVVGNKKLN